MSSYSPSFAVELVGREHSPRQADVFARLVALTLERGFARYTLEQAAVALRCSKSTIYALAGSREQLIRAVVVSFFREAAERVERRVAAESDPVRRVEAYLLAVADELRPASAAFMDDVAAFPPAREIYERNTVIATQRVRELILDGIELRAFRDVPAEFVAEVVTSAMVRIQQGVFAKNTGLTDAESYADLANLVVNGIIRPS
ncbi:TetR/AcrR family transcriptional regulator [Lysinimonas soli]|uniref:TetR/AcrR family transcriptional regulator n=1 Tax=Lysinimonas soli TaxID=1074233 RepID=A0ABW0NSE5_9MICO